MEFNKLIPELSVSDLKKSLEFYTTLLGFKVEYSRPEDKFVFLSYNGSQIMLEEINHHWETGSLTYPFGRGINFQFNVENVDELEKSLKKQGYPLFLPMQEKWRVVQDMLYGVREFLVQDPDGYLLRFAQRLGIRNTNKSPK